LARGKIDFESVVCYDFHNYAGRKSMVNLEDFIGLENLIVPINTKNKIIFQKNKLVIADGNTLPVVLHFENGKEVEDLIGMLFMLKAGL
jgi:hypothetical protein